jgi:hypothetical protein
MNLKGSIQAVLREAALKAPIPAGRVPSAMKIPLDTPLLDFDGQPIKEKADADGLTMRRVLIRSAMYIEDGNNPPGEAKFKQYQLAAKIDAIPPDGAANFSIEELAALKANVGKMWLPLIVGRVWSILDKHEHDEASV